MFFLVLVGRCYNDGYIHYNLYISIRIKKGFVKQLCKKNEHLIGGVFVYYIIYENKYFFLLKKKRFLMGTIFLYYIMTGVTPATTTTTEDTYMIDTNDTDQIIKFTKFIVKKHFYGQMYLYEDMVSEGLLSVYSIVNPVNDVNYLYTVIKNAIIDYLKKENNYSCNISDTSLDDLTIGGLTDMSAIEIKELEGVIAAHKHGEKLVNIFEGLTQGKTLKELGEDMGMTKQAVSYYVDMLKLIVIEYLDVD